MKYFYFLPLLLILGCGTSDLALSSPLDYQVFQRQTKTQGTVSVQGMVLTPVDSVEARFSGQSISGPLPDVWYPVTLDKSTFHADLPIPAGGFYVLTLRTSTKGALVEYSVRHVGVGEVFVVSGQSNSTNYGEVKQVVQSGMVAALGPNGWQIANDPQPGVQDGSGSGSFIPSFGDEMFKKYGVPIGVASVGHGSTSVRQWLPKGSPMEVMPTVENYFYYGSQGEILCNGILYDYMAAQIKSLGKSGFRALLWHQGESDSHQPTGHNITGDTYETMMRTLIANQRADAGWSFPWFVAEATYHTPDDQATPEIQTAQIDLWNSAALQGPNTDALTMQYREMNGQGQHMNDAGLKLHGRLWAQQVGSYLDPLLK